MKCLVQCLAHSKRSINCCYYYYNKHYRTKDDSLLMFLQDFNILIFYLISFKNGMHDGFKKREGIKIDFQYFSLLVKDT